MDLKLDHPVDSALGAVGWELHMAALMAARVGDEDSIAHTAYLESFLVHLRCLLEFFLGREGKDGRRRWNAKDLKPTDYLPDWQPPADDLEAFTLALDLIDSTLSHISLTRARGNYSSWTPAAVTETVIRLARRFRDALRDAGHPEADGLSPWLIWSTQALWGAPKNPPSAGYTTMQNQLLYKHPPS